MTRGIIRDGNNPQATKKHLRNHIEMARCSQGTLCRFMKRHSVPWEQRAIPPTNQKGLRNCAAL